MKKKAIVIGAGIVGLAMSRALAKKGYQVDVYDRSAFAVGASIRNFGMVWPIGQTEGKMYERAMLTRSIWVEISNESGIWHDPVGSFHLAYTDLEMEVLDSFYQKVKGNRNYVLMLPQEVLNKSSAVNPAGLKGGLYSPDEIIVDSPLAIAVLPTYLNEKYGVNFHWQQHVMDVDSNQIHLAGATHEADEIYVCNGPDFENLFPELFNENMITKCKLQMMKTVPQPNDWRLGPSLCGGLSLTHYHSFQAAGDILNQLKDHYKNSLPAYVEWGIHVMVSQNSRGELIIGDSHEYGPTHDPFDKQFINQLILDYLHGFGLFPDNSISATWNGTYPKLKNGGTELVLSPIPGVTIVNGVGGAGMTLSFGLAEQIVNQ
jgi:FAD dependent oxidoreductase TIGR03364